LIKYCSGNTLFIACLFLVKAVVSGSSF